MDLNSFPLCVDCRNGDLRLVNGDSAMEGRVEICMNNSFGTVCDRQWDVLDTKVACRQLGYTHDSKTFLIESLLII